MANADEDEEAEEKSGRRDKKEERAENKKRASENEVVVNKELMKQVEDSVYNRVVTFMKTATPSGGATSWNFSL